MEHEAGVGILLCRYARLKGVKYNLFIFLLGMIEQLESRGMVTYACKGAPRMAKVSLRINEDEVYTAFGNKAMLGAITEDVTCICK